MAKQSESGNSTSKLSVLIAEPEPDIQAVYKSFLSGWNVVFVDTAEKCLQKFAEPNSVFDVVIIDSHARGGGAIEAMNKIMELAPDQHVVITSTNTHDLVRTARNSLEGKKIDVIQKPFKFVQLLSLLRSKAPRTSKVGLTDHVLAIYENADQELAEALAFLRHAALNNETALFLVRKEDDMEELIGRMRKGKIDVDSLLSDGSLVIMRNEDWYIPDRNVDKHRIINQWKDLVDRCVKSGRKGLRAFCMMDCFFEHGLAEEVVDYEHTLPAKFEMSFVPVCAYRKHDIDMLSEDQKRRLIVCHSHVWTGDTSHH